jgi:hypothetical protein
VPTTMINVRVLDNLDPMAMTLGYQPGDPLRCVFFFERPWPEQDGRLLSPKEMAIAAAEDVFVVFNSDDRPNGRYSKSFSVGDVVEVSYGDGTTWLACAIIGFVEIEDPGPAPFDTEVPSYGGSAS